MSVALLSAVGSASAADKIKIGVSMYTQSTPYFVAQLDAAKKVAEKMGCDVVATDAGNDMIKQIADVEDMISQGIKVLILNPRDPKGLIPATQACTAAKIPVVCMDSSHPVEVATKSVEIAIKAAKGELPPNFPKLTLTEPVAITKDNVALETHSFRCVVLLHASS